MSGQTQTVRIRNDLRNRRSRTRIEKEEGYQLIRLEEIRPPANPLRETMDNDNLEGLVESIRLYGILQPIVVSPRNDAGSFVVIAGHRRYRACRILGMREVPAVIRTPSLAVSLVENVQRQDLHPIEEARGYQQLTDIGLTQEQIGHKVGKSNVYVSQILGLLRLDERIQTEWFSDPKVASKDSMLQVATLQTSKQIEAWNALKRGEKTKDLIKTLTRDEKGRKAKAGAIAPRPHTVISRAKSTSTFFQNIDVSTWQDKTRERLRQELDSAITTLTALKQKLEK